MPRTITTDTSVQVNRDEHGQRLDRFLAARFSSCGLRGWRRLCEGGGVLVNGRTGAPGVKLLEGQSVTIVSGLLPDRTSSALCPTPFPVTLTSDLAAVCKPSGMHSAALSGRADSSVESLLATGTLVPPVDGFSPTLLNRLDYGTSGLLMVARSDRGIALWREAEDAGMVDKRYLALVHGLPETSLLIRIGLDTANRSRSKALAEETPDPLRHTAVEPLGSLDREALKRIGLNTAIRVGLVACRIRKGARHQIRAHLAWAGYPLIGDTAYGSPCHEPFFLHHSEIILPAFSAHTPAPWTGFESAGHNPPETIRSV